MLSNHHHHQDLNPTTTTTTTASQPKLPSTSTKSSTKLSDLPDPPSQINFTVHSRSNSNPIKHLILHRRKTLGTGGFARCYEADDNAGRKFALKIVDKIIIKNSKHAQKLRHEVRIQTRMKHPNIVELFGWKEDEQHVYILLELCPNGSLQELVKARKRLSEPESARFFNDLVLGVQYLHERNIIHRDLKLGNIFLAHDMSAKIGDFGLATEIVSEHDRKKTICGTPNYIAPEILTGHSTSGHSIEVDIWSLGIILYSMLIGRPPFQTSDVNKIYKRINNLDYEFPPAIPLSLEAKTLISSMLQKLPSSRPLISQLLDHPFVVSGTRPKDKLTPDSTILKSTLVPDTSKDQLIPISSSISSTKHVSSSKPHPTALANAPHPPNMMSLDRYPTGLHHNKLHQISTARLLTHSQNESSPSHISRSSSLSLPKPRLDEVSKSFSEIKVTAEKKLTSSIPVKVNDDPETTSSNARYRLTRSRSERIGHAIDVVRNPPTPVRSLIEPPAVPKKNEPPLAPPSTQAPQPPVSMIEALYTNLTTAWAWIQQPHDSSSIDHLHQLRIDPEQQINNEPIVYVSKCIDYCEKYGLGYQLSNGVTGVYFNDMTILTQSPSKTRLEYLNHVLTDNNAAKGGGIKVTSASHGSMKRQCFKMTEYPPELQKKITLLTHFSHYMETQMVPSLNLTNNQKDDNNNHNSNHHHHPGLVFLTKFYHGQQYGSPPAKYNAYRLSNRVFQVNFSDRGKLVLAIDGKLMLYIMPDKSKKVHVQLADLKRVHQQVVGKCVVGKTSGGDHDNNDGDVFENASIAADFLDRVAVAKSIVAKIRDRRIMDGK